MMEAIVSVGIFAFLVFILVERNFAIENARKEVSATLDRQGRNVDRPREIMGFKTDEATYCCLSTTGQQLTIVDSYEKTLARARERVTPARKVIILKLQPFEAVEIPVTVTKLES